MRALSSLGLALEQDELPPGTQDLRSVTLVYQGWGRGNLGLKRGLGPQATQGVGSCWKSWHLASPCIFGAFLHCPMAQEAAL